MIYTMLKYFDCICCDGHCFVFMKIYFVIVVIGTLARLNSNLLIATLSMKLISRTYNIFLYCLMFIMCLSALFLTEMTTLVDVTFCLLGWDFNLLLYFAISALWM
ncbi:hypothetical protein ACOSQ4_017551 [Xanthoceras sorbifolium]